MNAGAIAVESDSESPELIAARRAIAGAPEMLHAFEGEALRLAPLIARGEIAWGNAAAYLIDVAVTYGLCGTERERETVEHVIREGLAGRSVGVGFSPAPVNGATRLPIEPRAPLRPLNLAEFPAPDAT